MLRLRSPRSGPVRTLGLLASGLLAACATGPARRPSGLGIEALPSSSVPGETPGSPERFSRPSSGWAVGQPLLHGFLGVSEMSKVSVDGSGSGQTDGDRGEADEYPVIGGGAQWKLGGQRLDYGLEGLLSFGGRSNAEAFAAGGGGAVVVVDVDLLVFELFGGPFASLMLGDKLRVYGGAGPVLQWANWDQSGPNLDDTGSGFGYGTYARAGVELALPSRSLLGLGVRWSDTSVDLGGSLGDLEMDGLQIFLTVSRWN